VLAGSRGIGRACAEVLAAEGATVAVCARDGDAAQAVAAEIAGHGFDCDVSDARSLERFLAEAVAALGGVDVLVTNCGGPKPGDAAVLDDADWQTAFDLVFMSVVRACRHVLPAMRKQRFGRIVNITSPSVREPIPGLALSNALRPAIAGYSKSLAREVAADGVHVHCVMPGSILTDRNRELGAAAAEQRSVPFEQIAEEWRQNVPLGRLGDALDVGRMVAFLASEACSFTTGAVIPVEGGTLRSL